MMLPTTPLFGPIPGGPELLIIVAIAVLLFGAQKLPKLARSVGQAQGEFKKGRQDLEDELADATTTTDATAADRDPDPDRASQ